MEWLTSPEAWIALLSLTALEIVLGVDNIIFISILVGRLPPEQRHRARLIGLALAMVMRIGLLLSLAWMMRLTDPVFAIHAHEVSGRDLILIGGGLFLLAKSVLEIHNSLEGDAGPGHSVPKHADFYGTLAQIAIIDIVFSLDSVITAVGMVSDIPVMVLAIVVISAVGMVSDIPVMVLAIVIAVGVMMFAAKPIGDFVDAHPTIKMLALAFLILVGVALIGEGIELHIPKGYIYFAMAFAVGVEMLNLRLRKARRPLKLHKELQGNGADDDAPR
jgi:predicted tellurium resistance membrane protein TerC